MVQKMLMSFSTAKNSAYRINTLPQKDSKTPHPAKSVNTPASASIRSMSRVYNAKPQSGGCRSCGGK